MKPINSAQTLVSSVAVCALLALAAPPANAAGGSSVPPPSPQAAPSATPEEQATQLYNDALAARDRAWRLEEKAEDGSDEGQDKLQARVEKNFEKAAKKLEKAVELNPSMYQAHSSLGYALRRLGRYPEALVAYDKALDLNPSYVEAIEYRAEAYLGLNRLEEAKKAYMILMKNDRARADELLRAMDAWLVARRQNPAGVPPEELKDFAEWFELRSEAAEQTAQLSGGGRIW